MYKLIKIDDSKELADLKADHLATLNAPLDAYWEEAIIGFADHFEVEIDGSRAGFYCLNGENQLVAFFLAREFAGHSEDVLSVVIKEHSITSAMAGTNDPFFLSHCLDIATETKVHTLLFEDNDKAMANAEGFGELSFEAATEEEFDEVFRIYCGAGDAMDEESVETGFEGLKGYIRSVMSDHNIFVLREDGKLIATSECRISKTQKPFADVGMIVGVDQRRRGVGSHILRLTKEYCYKKEVLPICSCETGNIGSKKAIGNAGFISRHRIIEVKITSQ